MMELRLNNISAGYRNLSILHHISLVAKAGEILILLGENGCGKTTLLRAIQGSIPLLDGQITIGGRDLSALSTRRRAEMVTTMAQEHSAEPGLTGMDRIEMGFFPKKGLFGRLEEKEITKIREMADIFGILSLLNRDMAEMSAISRTDT